MDGADDLNLVAEFGGEACWEDSDAILLTLSVPDDNVQMIEFDILHAQPHSLHNPEAGAIEEPGQKSVCTVKPLEYGGDFAPTQHDGEFGGNLGAGEVAERAGIDVEDVLVEEDDGVEGLVLGGGSDVALDSEVGEEGAYVGGAEVLGVAPAVEMDVAPEPGEVGLFRTDAVVTQADFVAHFLQELPRTRWRGRRVGSWWMVVG